MTYNPDQSKISSWRVASTDPTLLHHYSDFSLRVGTVIAKYSSVDSPNFSKKYAEYDVRVDYGDLNGSISPIIYYRLKVQSIFGGEADFSDWTLRVSDKNKKIEGSRVLLLCNNGNQRDAYIIGGLKNLPDDKKEETLEDNHHYTWEFNGIKQNVNNDGEFLLLRRGQTKDDGTVEDDTNSYASLSLTKDGKITVGYSDSADYPYFVLDRENKQATLSTKDKIFLKTENTLEITTSSGVKINPNNPDPQAFVRGTYYRQQESSLNNKMKEKLLDLTTTLATLYASLNVTGASLTAAGASLAVPIVGGPIAAPSVTAAGSSLLAANAQILRAQSILLEMITAVQSFEALGSKYLSDYHIFGETP